MSDAALGIGRRVLVTGMAGSGKSTFSRSLAAKTGLPVIHLDLHFWKPGWVAPSELEWREKQSGLLAGDAWIADGNYHETLDLRLERADTVVFLDTPWWVCAGRAFLRGLRKPVGEMPEGCDDSSWRRLRDEWRLAIVIWRNRRSEPEREHEIISQYGQHAVLHALGSKRAAKEFLDGLDVEYTEANKRLVRSENPRRPGAPWQRDHPDAGERLLGADESADRPARELRAVSAACLQEMQGRRDAEVRRRRLEGRRPFADR